MNPKFADGASAQLLAISMLCVAALLPTVAWSQDHALRRCRDISDPAVRLACYDALTLLPAAPTPAAGVVPPPDPQRDFGKPAAAGAEPAALQSRLTGTFTGWEPNQQLELANGQVWRIVDGSRAYVSARPGPPVRIESGVFGAYYLSVDGVTQAPRVRRVK